MGFSLHDVFGRLDLQSTGEALPVDTPTILKAGITRVSVTCTNANTDYDPGAAIPAGTVRVLVYSTAYDAVIGVVTTTASNGAYLKSDTVYEFKVTAGDTLHVQSPNAGTVVKISYLPS